MSFELGSFTKESNPCEQEAIFGQANATFGRLARPTYIASSAFVRLNVLRSLDSRTGE